MSDTIGFNKEWLNERYRFDTAARNQKVEKACLNYFKEKETLRIADVGAGTGANVIYFLNRFPMHQKWTLIEHDPILIQAAKDRFYEFSRLNKYAIHEENNKLTIAAKPYQIEIEFTTISLLEIAKWKDIQALDLITAGAVFDLFSLSQFEVFAKTIIEYKVAFLATINYQGMSFTPEEVTDTFYIQKYEAHMVRPQDFGIRMAMDCNDLMTNYFQKIGSQITTGPSDWHIEVSDEKMLEFLLTYMETAIKELPMNPTESNKFDRWVAQKRQLILNQKLSMEVQHSDLFVSH